MLLICDCPTAILGWRALLDREVRGVSLEELLGLDTFGDGVIVRLNCSGIHQEIGVPQNKLETLLEATSGKVMVVVDGFDDWPLLVRLSGHGVKYLCSGTAVQYELRSTLELMLQGGEESSSLKQANARLSAQRNIVSALGGEHPLTPRETDVVQLMTCGLTNKQIARKLEISYETVKEHVQHILRKLGCRDRTSASVKVARATRQTPLRRGA